MIYFITQGSRYIKVGYVKDDPVRRLRMLQTGNPDRMRLAMVLEGTAGEEKKIHNMFMPYHIRGEWFFLTGEIEDQLAEWQEYCVLSEINTPNRGHWIRKGKMGVHKWD